MSDWRLDVRGEAGPKVHDAFQRTFDNINKLLSRVETIEKVKPAAINPKALREALQAGGAAPINLQNLIGQAAQPQLAYVPNAGLSLPDVIADPLSQDRQLILRNNQFYVFDGVSQPGLWTSVGISTLIDTHARRLDATNFPQYQAANLAPGTLFFETDRTVFYIVKVIAAVNTWVYAAGEMSSSSTTIADIPLDLGANDVGFIYNSTYWFHRWLFINSGATGYTFAPGDPGAGYIVASTGTAPTGGKWGLCDGSAYSFIDKTATATSVTSPNLQTGAFVRAGPYSGPTTTAASRAKWETTAVTDFSGTHHHGVFFSCGTFDGGGVGSAQSIALCGFSVNTTDDGSHQHGLTDANAQLKVPSDANGGLPLNMELDWWVRL